MSGEQGSPLLVEALRASTSKLQKTKSVLDAREKELSALQAQLEHDRRELENLAARLETDRQANAREREEVRAARTSVDTDLVAVHEQREKLSAESLRLQESAQALAERERTLRDGESRLERLDQDIVGRMNESEAKFRAIANRDEELLKVQQHWLIVFETRQKDLQAISEQMQVRQKQSAQMHQSLADLHNVFKGETARLASQREELAAKERSLIEAQKYLVSVLETSEPEPNNARPPAPPQAKAAPPPPQAARALPEIELPTRSESVVVREPETKLAVTKNEALDRLTQAIEASKRARDEGKNIGDIRGALKMAKSELDAGNYENAAHIADEILEELRVALIAK